MGKFFQRGIKMFSPLKVKGNYFYLRFIPYVLVKCIPEFVGLVVWAFVAVMFWVFLGFFKLNK